MQFRFIISLFCIFTIALSSACSSAAVEETEEVLLNDVAENELGEISFEDVTIELSEQQIATSAPSTQEAKQILGDQSEVVKMNDGFGNETETRYFRGHPRLNYVVVRKFTDGRTEVYFYGYSKVVKSESEEAAAKALTAPADELASLAGIRQPRSTEGVTNFMTRKTSAPEPAPINDPYQNAGTGSTLTSESRRDPGTAPE